jgi:hypothetical protein
MGLVAIAASSALVLGACGGGGNETGNQAQSPNQAQPPANQNGGNNAGAGNAAGSSCVAASQVLDNTQSFAGKQVTVTGTVGQTIGQHAFAVAINNSGGILGGNNNSNNSNSGANTNGQMLLAVAKQSTALPTQGSPVQITGVLQPTFDANQAATFAGGNLDQANWTAWNGKPYVEAAFAGPISTNLTSGQGSSIVGGSNSGNNCAQASRVLDNAQSYAGQQVTLTGTVGQAIGSHAFTITANNNTGSNTSNNAQTLLAVAKETTGMPTPGSPIQVTGTLQPTFDMNQAAAFAGGNLDQAGLNAYNGKPYVQAVFAGPVSANLTNGQGGS